MNVIKNNKTFLFIVILSVAFFIAVAFDISPLLRGPADYPPDWRWPYYFVNTSSRLWLPLVIGVCIVLAARKVEKMQVKKIKIQEKEIIMVLVMFSIIFQISVLYFSRSGISVLFQRIAHPEHNGYFTSGTEIKNIPEFLRRYNKNVLDLHMHAQGHPPGAILFFSGLNALSSFSGASVSIVSHVNIEGYDNKKIWNTLSDSEKFTSMWSGFFIIVLSSVAIVPLYHIGKLTYNVRVAMRSIFIYISIPSIILFVPLNDVFLPLFPLSSFLFFINGIKHINYYHLILSGIIFFIGISFSISILPIICIFLIYLIRANYKEYVLNYDHISKQGIAFFAALISPMIILYFTFQLNSLELFQTLLSGLPEERKYTTWVYYNLYDFFIFTGIPIMVFFISSIYYYLKCILRKDYKKVDTIFVATLIMILVVNFSGGVRGETARIWIPFIPFVVLSTTEFMTRKIKFSSIKFQAVFLLMLIQVLVMQEFWVPLW